MRENAGTYSLVRSGEKSLSWVAVFLSCRGLSAGSKSNHTYTFLKSSIMYVVLVNVSRNALCTVQCKPFQVFFLRTYRNYLELYGTAGDSVNGNVHLSAFSFPQWKRRWNAGSLMQQEMKPLCRLQGMYLVFTPLYFYFLVCTVPVSLFSFSQIPAFPRFRA
jgi:hypothetical protein